MRFRSTRFTLAAALLAMACCITVTAAENVSQREVLGGLSNPCGVAVQPGTGDVFVSDSAAGRVLRVSAGSAGSGADVITDFPQDIYGKGPMYDIGPLGLGFIDQSTLVVGGGGLPDGSELLRIYEVPASGSIKADDMKHKLGPLGPSEQTIKGEGNFYGIAVDESAIYITCNGDDTKGWVSRVKLDDGQPGELEPFIATKVATEVDAPVGVAIRPRGGVVIGQMGEITVPGDSLLTLYNRETAEMVINLETGLFDIAGLAYSPSGKLYAVDFAWMDTTQGGLFRLDVERDGDSYKCTPVKLLSLDKPSALAFGEDGTLYVTVFGSAKEGSDEKPGKLIAVEGDL